MVNYDKSTIYKLCCKDPKITDIYVGSTTNFTRRKSAHKTGCNNENDERYNLKVYKTIREYGGWSNWDMVEVERYCATDRKDLHARERFWLEELGATLNMCIPTQSDAEYYQQNKDKKIEQMKEYYKKNRDKLAEQMKQYYAKNREKIIEKKKEKVECECGTEVSKSYLPKHRKSKKHQTWVEQNTALHLE